MNWLEEARENATNWLARKLAQHPVVRDLPLVGGLLSAALLPAISGGMEGAVLGLVSGIAINVMSSYVQDTIN
jgi:hypothetical protein